MTDRPILFSAPMIRALLSGRKTQTRRLLKPQPTIEGLPSELLEDHELRGWLDIPCGEKWATVKRLPYAPGDRLWVKETWRPSISAADPWHVAVLYPHDGRVKHWGWSSDADFGDWTIPKAAEKGNVTPLFMPRWASRLTLTVTDVRVQRLQKISGEDCIAEGACEAAQLPLTEDEAEEARQAFRNLWNSLHGPSAWDANPWVSAISFDVHRCNIDQMGGAG